MTTLKDVLRELETATNPDANVIHKGGHFEVLALGFNKGMLLKEYKLFQYYEIDIPVSVSHSIEAMNDSLCLLIQG